MRVIHKKYGAGTANPDGPLPVKRKGNGVEVVFDTADWPHFGRPIWCNVTELTEVEEEQPQEEATS